jgi:hypothetical protein
LVVELLDGEGGDEGLARVLREMTEPQGRFGTILLAVVLG